MIERVEPVAHEIPGDELPRLDECLQRIDLVLLVVHPCISRKVFPLQHQSGIMFSYRDRDFSPIVIRLAPIRGPPVLIQRIQRVVFLFQPFLELFLGVFVV